MAHQFFFNPYILDSLPAPDKGFDVVQDISEPRLRMYITSRGVKTFFVRKRIHGKDKRIIIGNYPDTDIETARGAVSEILSAAIEKKVTHKRKITLNKFLKLYIEKKVRRNNQSRDKLERAINRHFPAILGSNIDEISTEDIKKVIDNIPGRAIAGRMQEFLQSVFKYATETGYVKQNPVLAIPKIKQHCRIRPLNKSGFHRLTRVINAETDPVLKSAFLMLIYGFASKASIFAMQWRDLDFNHYTWCEKPLSDMAVVLLQDLPQNGRWVFPGRGRSHLTDPRVAWKRVAIAAGIPNLTMDDVNKFIMRQLIWSSDKELLRENMNTVLSELMP